MKMKILAAGGACVCLLLAGCYNKPSTSERFPGAGPVNYTSGPSVGPGTTAGGSTAGPQPRVPMHGGDVEPQPGGATHGSPAEQHHGAAEPVMAPHADTPIGPASRVGNEEGGDGRGPAPAHGSSPVKH